MNDSNSAPLEGCPTAQDRSPTQTSSRPRRADLHVHSYHSRVNGNMPFLKSRDCYSAPEDVYRIAKARGMDFVTITDHDSIDGCLEYLDRHPDARDFIIGEEVTCRMQDGDIEVHLAVYGTDEALHRDLQPLRGNVFEAAALLRERGVFFVLNHLLHFYRGQVPLPTYLSLLQEVPALEARNGTMLPAHNELIEQIARTPGGFMQAPKVCPTDTLAVSHGWAAIGGSDAHTLRRVATTWTEADGETPEAFLASLAARRSRVGGLHGGAGAVIGDVYGVIGRYVGSLLGVGPQDHGAIARTLCLAFSAGSLPFQFIPALIALSTVRRQSRAVARAIDDLASTFDRHPLKGCPTDDVDGGRAATAEMSA
jgi:predicted metal-dependent phosphoesterase TrpH